MIAFLTLWSVCCAFWSTPGMAPTIYTVQPDSLILAVQLYRADFFYIGIDNAFSVVALGSKPENLEVRCEGACTVRSIGPHDYAVHCERPGRVALVVRDPTTGKTARRVYRVKWLPSPTLTMGRYSYGTSIPSEEFRAQTGLAAVLVNLDLNTHCQIETYTLYHQANRRAVATLTGTEGRFSGAVAAAIQQARPGDQYLFADVRVRCPGDLVPRVINGLAFTIR